MRSLVPHTVRLISIISCHEMLSRNPGALTSWNPLGLSSPVKGLLYLYLYSIIICLYSIIICLYSIIFCLYSTIICPYSIIICPYSITICPYSIITCLYSIIIFSIFFNNLSIFYNNLNITEMHTLRCYIWSIALYGAKTWTLREVD